MRAAAIAAVGAGLAVAGGVAVAAIPETNSTPLRGPARDSNLNAFLRIIREGESSDNYSALVGGGEFDSFADHPARLGWPGIRRADGRLTTAAGAYQITLTTFLSLNPDGLFSGDLFGPDAQDEYAIALLKRRGAYDAILAGDIALAVSRLPNEWEIFTLARYSVDKVISKFELYGGFTA